MSDQDDKTDTFPTGFEHVGERLNKTTELLRHIDSQIEHTLEDQGPKVVYRPPGFIGTRNPGTRGKAVAWMKSYQDKIKAETLSMADAETRNASNKDGRAIRDHVRQELYPNPFRELSERELNRHIRFSKEIEQSQDYMDAKLVAKAAERKSMLVAEKQTPEPSQPETMSMSARFVQSLGYTKASDKPNVSLSPAPDRQPDRD